MAEVRSVPPRKPRTCLVGARLTVLKTNRGWEVLYVSKVDDRHTVWAWTFPGGTTNSWGVQPFRSWDEAMAHAATLRTYYGDQCRGDSQIWDQWHGRTA